MRRYADKFSGNTEDIYKHLTQKQNRKILDTVSEDARTLGASRRARTTNEDNEAPSTIGEEEFEFDDVIVNSRTYRRAFAAVQRQSQQIDEVRGRQRSQDPLNSTRPLGKTFLERASDNVGRSEISASKSRPDKKAPSYFRSLFRAQSKQGSGKLNVPSTTEDQMGSNIYIVHSDANSATPAMSRPFGEVEADRHSDLNYEHSETSARDMIAEDTGQSHNLERQIAYQRDRWRYLHNLASQPIEPKESLEDFEELERSKSGLLHIEGIFC